MNTNDACVLIVGIDHYESNQLAPLKGARNDAVAWYRYCVHQLRVNPRNITVLANPPLSPRELGPEAETSTLRGASRAEVLEGATWLAEKGAATGGLFTFSGHGLAVPFEKGGESSDLALCTSDTSVTSLEGGAADVKACLRFSELGEIFKAQKAKDNITVIVDACYGDGVSPPKRAALNAGSTSADAGDEQAARARRITKPVSFTNRMLSGTRHWNRAHEVYIDGKWRGAASFAMLTLIERWGTKTHEGVVYPNVSYADLVMRTQQYLDVLGVPQTPAFWGDARVNDMPLFRPGSHFSPGETHVTPTAEMLVRQCPTDPDKVALITILDQNSNPIIHVIVVGANLPRGVTGYSTRTEYWYTNTTSQPTLTGLTYRVEESTDQTTIDNFHSGYTLSIQCAQLIGESNWPAWSSGINTQGRLFQTSDPTGNNTYMGLYLEYRSNGNLLTYAWYRITLLTDGFAYTTTATPSSFSLASSTDPNSMQSGAWKYSLVV
ncbi:MAG: caspase family protein [Polyangiaceae bacterium]|nr:caspase family protein [Polyangiaceae bacterium]